MSVKRKVPVNGFDDVYPHQINQTLKRLESPMPSKANPSPSGIHNKFRTATSHAPIQKKKSSQILTSVAFAIPIHMTQCSDLEYIKWCWHG
eukprot:724255_1